MNFRDCLYKDNDQTKKKRFRRFNDIGFFILWSFETFCLIDFRRAIFFLYLLQKAIIFITM